MPGLDKKLGSFLTGGVAVCAMVSAGVDLGCSKYVPEGCRVAQQTVLPRTSLTLMSDVRMDRVGDGFALIGYEAGGTGGGTIRWAKLGADGGLGTESTLALPARIASLGPWFGLAGKAGLGDQLIALYAVPKAGAPNQVEIDAITQDAGAATGSAPVLVLDLPAGVDTTTFQMAMASSSSGKHSVLAWGLSNQKADLKIQILKADAASPGQPILVKDVVAPWDCLALTPGRTDLAVSVFERSTEPSWRATEMGKDGVAGASLRLTLNAEEPLCPTVGFTAAGYVLTWQTANGTFFAEYDLSKAAASPRLFAGATSFGGTQSQPRVACVAHTGKDFSVIFDRPTGPEVWRIDVFGLRHGGTLHLPATEGKVGPVSAWPIPEAAYATYLDQIAAPADGGLDGGNNMGNQRYLIKVDCPMEFGD